MNKFKEIRIGLSQKILILIIGLLFVSNNFVGLVTNRIVEKLLATTVKNQLASISNDVANQIESINNQEIYLLRSIADMDYIRDESISLQEKQNLLSSIIKTRNNPIYENLAFYDKEGNAITADGRTINFAARPYFSEAFSGKNFISDPKFSEVTQSVLQHMSVPVYGFDNKPIGAIVLVINGNEYDKIISAIDIGGGMHPSIINRTTKATVANVNPNTGEEAGELDPDSEFGKVMNDLFAGNSDVKDFVDPAINAHLIAAYKPIENTTWSIFAVAPYDYYFAGIKTVRLSILIILCISIIISVVLCIFLVKLLIKPLISVKDSITEISTGHADLTKRLPSATNDEVGDVVNGFNQFVDKLQNIVSNLSDSNTNLELVDKDLQECTQDATSAITEIIANIESVQGQISAQAGSVQETAGAVNQISSNIESLEKMIGTQTGFVQQASSAVEQMIGNINSVNCSVQKMIKSFTQLEEHSNRGIETQSHANEKISQIETQSKMLLDANAAIANIANQTNLLAMNAAIEAAHAGDAGKGFSVVADEIRKLSETSTAQSKTIGAELVKIQNTIKEVVAVSIESNEAFSEVSSSISETSQIINQITGAMEEQQIGSKQIIDALQYMNNSTSEVRTASKEMTDGNSQILEEIKKLQDATDMIQRSIEEMHVGAEQINKTGVALSEMSQKVTDSIAQTAEEIGQFKI